MSSSSKLSFQSGDSPSAGRKSWPGFHGLKALDFEEGSREQKHSHLPSPRLCLCTQQQGSLMFQVSITTTTTTSHPFCPAPSCTGRLHSTEPAECQAVKGIARALPAERSAEYVGHGSAMVHMGEEAHSKAITALRGSQKPSSLPHARAAPVSYAVISSLGRSARRQLSHEARTCPFQTGISGLNDPSQLTQLQELGHFHTAQEGLWEWGRKAGDMQRVRIILPRLGVESSIPPPFRH